MTSTETAIKSALEAIGTELAKLVSIVDENARTEFRERIFASVTGSPAPHANGVKPKSKPGKAATLTKKGGGAKRSGDEIRAQAARVFTYINSHPGQRAEQIAKALSVETKVLPRPVRLLLSEKKIKASGVARGTTYVAL